MINALTIDYEDWYQVPLANVPESRWDNCPSTLEVATPLILQFLKAHGIKATFFVTGYIADRHSDLVAKIFRSGHEVESHGYWHRLSHLQSPKEFAKDLRMSIDAITRVTGSAPIGYRAPAWSSSKDPALAVKALLDCGFIYDSSLFPPTKFKFGRNPLKPKFYKESTVKDNTGKLLEIPPLTLNVLGLHVPISGGFCARVCGSWCLDKILMIGGGKAPVVIYFHPWEVVNDYPKPINSLLLRFIQYYRCGRILDILAPIVSRYSFGSIGEAFPLVGKYKEAQGINYSGDKLSKGGC